MGTNLQKRTRPVLARLLESVRKQVKVGAGVQGPGEGGKRSLGNFGRESRAGSPWGWENPAPWIHQTLLDSPPARLLLSPARAFKWGGSFAQVCSAHPAGHC